jgi:hypothetical protein
MEDLVERVRQTQAGELRLGGDQLVRQQRVAARSLGDRGHESESRPLALEALHQR